MATQAKVTSTEAIQSFRSAMIVFMTKAKRSLDDASDAMRRTRQWVTHDQRVHYEGEHRRRRKALEQAEQEMMSARLAGTSQNAIMQRQMAVAKCQRDIADCENKIRKLKSWSMNFDASADPAIKRVDKLRHTLEEYKKAVAYLDAIQKALDAYTESARPAGGESGGESIASMAAELGIDLTDATAPEATPVPEGEAQSDLEPLPQIEPPPGTEAKP